MTHSRIFRPLATLALLLLTVAFLFTACDSEPDRSMASLPLRNYWKLPPIALTDQRNQPVTLDRYRGKILVANVFFATCPGTCLMLNETVGELQKRLGPDSKIEFVSFTVDPERDTPEALAKYAETRHASPRWAFATGTKADLWNFCKDGLKLPISESPNSPEPITHSARLVLVDRTGTVRGFHDGIGNVNFNAILADLKKLEAEPAQ